MNAFVASPLLLAGALLAQTTTYVAPTGYGSIPGAGGNSIPLWSTSATYQQVHDAADLATVLPGPAGVIRAISFRIPNGGSLAARTMDAQVTMGVTPVTAQTATTTFASNLGPTPVVVLPYTVLNLPAVAHASNPNPQSWFFPFTTPFPYVVAQGNLCAELRYRNMSATGGTFDVVSGSTSRLDPMIGTGCTATGQAQPSVIGARSLTMSTGAMSHRLDRAAANAMALMAIGVQPQHVTLPGLCGYLETVPLVSLSGTTDATGTWTSPLTLGRLYSFPMITIYTQFVWVDSGLAYGLGVSPCSPITLPPPTQTRVWYGTSTTMNNEQATTGSRETGYQYALVFGLDV